MSGQALGFLNVEVWDSTHKHPPLAQTTPNADGSFNVIVDTSLLPAGPATWTVFGWDSPPGYSYAHSATVTLHLTIAAPE